MIVQKYKVQIHTIFSIPRFSQYTRYLGDDNIVMFCQKNLSMYALNTFSLLQLFYWFEKTFYPTISLAFCPNFYYWNLKPRGRGSPRIVPFYVLEKTSIVPCINGTMMPGMYSIKMVQCNVRFLDLFENGTTAKQYYVSTVLCKDPL